MMKTHLAALSVYNNNKKKTRSDVSIEQRKIEK